MRSACPIVTGLVVLGLICCSGSGFAADQVFQLTFEKSIALGEQPDVFTYTINKGDYVYAILRDFNVPHEMLEEMIEVVKSLNPQLQNLDLISPGDPLYLPAYLQHETRQSKKQPDLETARGGLSSIQSLDYRVKPGDTVFEILKQTTGLSKEVILDRYLQLFAELNPDLPDINRIAPGQRIRVPLPQSRRGSLAENTPAARAGVSAVKGGSKNKAIPDQGQGVRAEDAVELEPEGLRIEDVPSKDIVESILEKTGLDFVTGSELLLPGVDQSWIRINLEQMGLARTEWGDSILFVPGALQNPRDNSDFSRAGLKTCLVPRSWDRTEVLNRLEAITRPRLLFWPPGKRLIVNSTGAALELTSSCLLALRSQAGFSFYLFDFSKNPEANPSGLLTGFLQGQGVNFLVPGNGPHGGLVWEVPAPPEQDSLFVPTLSRSGFLSELRGVFPGQGLGFQGGALDFESVFPVLKKEGRAREELLTLELYQAQGISINLRLPVYRLTLPSGEIFLIAKQQSDPYLISLLNLMGYTSYQIEG